MLRDQAWFESPVAITRHVEGEGAVVGQHRLAARPIAMIRGLVGLRPARGIAQVMCQLAAQGTLNNRFLETTDGDVELLGGDRPLADELIQNLRRNGRERCVRHQGFPFARHRGSSCYAPHTKFLTPSGVSPKRGEPKGPPRTL